MSNGAPRPATPEDRDAALRSLDLALTQGQLDLDEHHRRMQVVLDAREAREVRRQLIDLQLPAPAPPHRPPLRDRARDRWRRSRAAVRAWPRAIKVAVAVWVACVSLGIGVAVVAPATEEPPLRSPVIESHDVTDDRWVDFRDAYEERFGTTLAGDLQLGALTYVDVPIDEEAGRYERWHWDGRSWSGPTARSSGADPVDLRDVDVDALAENARTAWTGLGVEEPGDVTLLLRISGPDEQAITLVVRNEFDEDGSLRTDLDGRELGRSPFTEPGSGLSD